MDGVNHYPQNIMLQPRRACAALCFVMLFGAAWGARGMLRGSAVSLMPYLPAVASPPGIVMGYSIGNDAEHRFAQRHLKTETGIDLIILDENDFVDPKLRNDPSKDRRMALGELAMLQRMSKRYGLSANAVHRIEECISTLEGATDEAVHVEEAEFTMVAKTLPSCLIFWRMMRAYLPMAEKIAEDVEDALDKEPCKPIEKLFVQMHGSVAMWGSDDKYPNIIFLKTLLHLLDGKVEPCRIALISCDIPPDVLKLGVRACTSSPGHDVVVNFTPWGFVAKEKYNADGKPNRFNLAKCYDATDGDMGMVPFKKEDTLLNICKESNVKMGRPVPDTFLEFPEISLAKNVRHGLLMQAVKRKETPLFKEADLARKDFPPDFLTEVLCKIGIRADVEPQVIYNAEFRGVLEARRMPPTHLKNLTDIFKKLLAHKFKKEQLIPDFPDDAVSQVRSFMKPFVDIFDAQPNELARWWLADVECVKDLSGYWKGILPLSMPSAQCMNRFLGLHATEGFRIPGGPIPKSPLGGARDDEEEDEEVIFDAGVSAGILTPERPCEQCASPVPFTPPECAAANTDDAGSEYIRIA